MRTQLFSGPTGTRVMDLARDKGMTITPREAIYALLENEELISEIIGEYVAAGADIILAPTVGATRIYLPDTKSVVKTNNRIITASLRVSADRPVSAMISLPAASCDAQIREVMMEQLKALSDTGVDGFMLETLTNSDAAAILTECALEAAVCTGRMIAIDVSLTPIEGFDFASAAERLKQYNLRSIGLNCFFPPEEMPRLLKEMPQDVALSMRPALSLPGKERVAPDKLCKIFADCLTDGRLQYIGTCCGARPEHTEYLKKLINND